jgi:hypothetical protein
LQKYNIKQTEDYPWLVMRHSYTNIRNVKEIFIKSFKIKEGDTVKFGKVQFKIREAFINNATPIKKSKSFSVEKEDINKDKNVAVAGDLTNNSIALPK